MVRVDIAIRRTYLRTTNTPPLPPILLCHYGIGCAAAQENWEIQVNLLPKISNKGSFKSHPITFWKYIPFSWDCYSSLLFTSCHSVIVLDALILSVDGNRSTWHIQYVYFSLNIRLDNGTLRPMMQTDENIITVFLSIYPNQSTWRITTKHVPVFMLLQ